MRSNITYSDQRVRCITEAGTYGFAFVLVEHDEGFNLFTYSIEDNTFNVSYSNITFLFNFVEMEEEYTYIGGMIEDDDYTTIHKVLYDGANTANTVFDLSEVTDNFIADSDYSIVSNGGISVIISNTTHPTILTATLVDIDPGIYEQSPSYIFNPVELFYFEPLTEYTIVQNWSGLLEFNFTCASESDFYATISSYLIEDHPLPTWVEYNNDTENLFVSTPIVTEDTDYYFTVESGTGTGGSYKFAKITVISSLITD